MGYYLEGKIETFTLQIFDLFVVLDFLLRITSIRKCFFWSPWVCQIPEPTFISAPAVIVQIFKFHVPLASLQAVHIIVKIIKARMGPTS